MNNGTKPKRVLKVRNVLREEVVESHVQVEKRLTFIRMDDRTQRNRHGKESKVRMLWRTMIREKQ